jgi:hypothetical protein
MGTYRIRQGKLYIIEWKVSDSLLIGDNATVKKRSVYEQSFNKRTYCISTLTAG